jgi:hypothetical protein
MPDRHLKDFFTQSENDCHGHSLLGPLLLKLLTAIKLTRYFKPE